MCLDEIERDHESPRKQQSHDQSEAGEVHYRSRAMSGALAPCVPFDTGNAAMTLTIPLSVELSRAAVQDRIRQQTCRFSRIWLVKLTRTS